LSAVLFGSISTLADTAELQRDAFNRAFEACGLDWRWERDVYLSMLETSGGAQRIADYAEARGREFNAEELALGATGRGGADIPVGWEGGRTRFEIDAPDATRGQLEARHQKAEQDWVGMQGLLKPPPIETEWG